MKIKKLVLAVSTLFISSTAFSAPVEFDTPDAHIIVMRALDSWSGDNTASEESLKAVKNREGGFVLRLPNGKHAMGFPTFGGSVDKGETVQGVVTELNARNFKLENLRTNFVIEKPVAIEPTQFSSFADLQRQIFESTVISSGNPTTLHNNVSTKKFFGALLSLGSIAVAGAKFGATGSQVVLNSGIAGDAYQITASSKAALTPVNLPSFDATMYKTIDARRVAQGQNERFGQVIIAYKTEKTDATEKDALIKAIVSLTGADTTPEAVQQSRNEDFTKRQALWDACVAEDKCKKD